MQPINFLRPDQREVQLQPWSEADLDQMAEVTETDKRRAAGFWRTWLPARIRGILDAVRLG